MHGDPAGVDLAVFLSDDPDLALVTADMVVWSLAHPCDCSGVCECDCICLEYGHGMNLTRVISRSCPVHGGGDDA